MNAVLRGAAAWVGWPLSILVLGTTGIAIGASDFIVYLLTVQTAISASVADIAQKHAQEEDAKRDARNDAIMREIRKNGKMMLEAVRSTNNLLTVLLERIDHDGRAVRRAKKR